MKKKFELAFLEESRRVGIMTNFNALQVMFAAISVSASVPGGIYSDLQRAGIIGDILYRFNDVLTRWVAYETWTYTGRFNGKE